MGNTTTSLRVPHLDHVVNGVYISGVRALYSLDLMKSNRIFHILKLYEYEPYWPSGFEICEIAIPDGVPVSSQKLKRGANFIQQCVLRKQRVLVQCGAGISRSSTFVLAYLLEQKYTLRDAYTLLQAKHPATAPAPALWQSLIDHYRLDHTLEEVLTWMD